MDKKSAIEKIRKCLALSKSSNQNEAATALRHAQALMEAHGVTDVDVLAAEAEEAAAKAGAKDKPSQWETALANTVGRAFGCKLIFVSGWDEGKWHFIGCAPGPEIAQYAFSVLLRQVKKERGAFIKEKCGRLIPASKTRRADLFCEGWVVAVQRQVRSFAGSEQQIQAIDAYTEKHYPSLTKFTGNDRNQGRNLRMKDWDARAEGNLAGQNAKLHHGVDGSNQPLALE